MKLQADGYDFVFGLLDQEQIDELVSALGPVVGAGRRGLSMKPIVRDLANSETLIELMSRRLGAAAKPVRAIFFDKSPETNWLVPWHQDLSIAVGERVEIEGYGPWSIKDGITHVQPPMEVLERMLTIRVHLDDCDESNGALEVIAGSHLHGRLSSSQIAEIRSKQESMKCVLKAGDALLMKPLLLHASGHSKSERHRRILHIEYAACELAPPLFWHPAA